MKKKTASYWLFLLPSLLGVLVFYVVPFGYSLYYALIDNMGSQEFVGLKNFSDTLTNSLFQSAAFNSAVFMVISVPLGMALALVLSLCLQKMKRGRVAATMVLLLPLVVPSGTIVYFWKVLFDSNGLVNELLLQLGPLPPVGEPEPVAHGHFSGHLSVEERELQHRAVLVGPELDPQNVL